MSVDLTISCICVCGFDDRRGMDWEVELLRRWGRVVVRDVIGVVIMIVR